MGKKPVEIANQNISANTLIDKPSDNKKNDDVLYDTKDASETVNDIKINDLIEKDDVIIEEKTDEKDVIQPQKKIDKKVSTKVKPADADQSANETKIIGFSDDGVKMDTDIQKEIDDIKKGIADDINKTKIAIADKQKNSKYTRDEEEFINIDVVVKGKVQTYKFRPNKDTVFAFVCTGYDDVLKEPCYRHIKNYTFDQIKNFNEFIEKYGCVCGDRHNHKITISALLEDLFKHTLVKPKEFEKRFVMYYLEKYQSGTILDVYKDQKT